MNLSEYTIEQLHDLNKAICAEISARRTEKNAAAVRNFAAGDKVYYISKHKLKVLATVEKPLRTNVDVITSSGQLMRVPASMLKFQDE